MIIYIKTLNGTKISLIVEQNQLINTIKLYIEEKEGIPVNQIRLIYNGTKLNDTNTINDYNIQSYSVIHMILASRGG